MDFEKSLRTTRYTVGDKVLNSKARSSNVTKRNLHTSKTSGVRTKHDDTLSLAKRSCLSPTGDEDNPEQTKVLGNLDECSISQTSSTIENTSQRLVQSSPICPRVARSTHVTLKPPSLPAIFTIRFGIDRLDKRNSSPSLMNQNIDWLEQDQKSMNDVPSENLKACLLRISLISPHWVTLTRTERRNLSLDEHINWFTEVTVDDRLAHTSQQELEPLTKQLRKHILQVLEFPDEGTSKKMVTVCLRLILACALKRLQQFKEVELAESATPVNNGSMLLRHSKTSDHSELPANPSPVPAEVVSVNLSHTPTLTIPDPSSGFSCSPGTKSTPSFRPNSRIWTPLSSGFRQDPTGTVSRHQRNRSKCPSRALLTRRSTSSPIGRPKSNLPPGIPATPAGTLKAGEHMGSYSTMDEYNVTTAPTLCTARRSASHPESLHRSGYYRLAFLPSNKTSARAKSSCEGDHGDDIAPTIQYSEDPYYSQVASFSFNETTGSKLPCDPNPTVRDQLRILVIYSIFLDLASETGCVNRTSLKSMMVGQVARERAERFLDQSIAVALTYRIDQLSGGASMELSQLISNAPINVSKIMDEVLLEGLSKDECRNSQSHSNGLAGENKVYRLAFELVKEVAATNGFSGAPEQQQRLTSKRLAQRILQLAYPAACFAMNQLLKCVDKRIDSTPRPQSQLCGISLRRHIPMNYPHVALVSTVPSPQSRLVKKSLPCAKVSEVTQPDLNWDNPTGTGELDNTLMSPVLTAKCAQTIEDLPNSPSLNQSSGVLLEVDSETASAQVLGIAKDTLRRISRPCTFSLRAEERSSCLVVSCTGRTDWCLSPHPVTNTDIASPGKREWHCTSMRSSRSEYISGLDSFSSDSGAGSPSYADPVGVPEGNRNQTPDKTCFHMTFSITQSIPDAKVSLIPTAAYLKRSCCAWTPVPVTNAAGDVLCTNCSRNLLDLIDLTSQTQLSASKLEANREESGQSIRSNSEEKNISHGEQQSLNLDDTTKTDPPNVEQHIRCALLTQDEDSSEAKCSQNQDFESNENRRKREPRESQTHPHGFNRISSQPRLGQTVSFSFRHRPTTNQTALKIQRGYLPDRKIHAMRTSLRAIDKNRSTFVQHVKPSAKPSWSENGNRGENIESSLQINRSELKRAVRASMGQKGDTRRSILMRNSASESSQFNQLEPPFHPSSLHSTANNDITNPFYSCLKELKDCLQKAEARLEIVNLLAAENASTTGICITTAHRPSSPQETTQHTTTALTGSPIPVQSRRRAKQWPLSSFTDLTNSGPQPPSSRGVKCVRIGQVSHTDNFDLHTRSAPLTVTNKPLVWSKWKETGCEGQVGSVTPASSTCWTLDELRSRGPTYFPAPSMQLPIRAFPSGGVRIDAGATKCLVYAKHISRRGLYVPTGAYSTDRSRCNHRIPNGVFKCPPQLGTKRNRKIG